MDYKDPVFWENLTGQLNAARMQGATPVYLQLARLLLDGPQVRENAPLLAACLRMLRPVEPDLVASIYRRMRLWPELVEACGPGLPWRLAVEVPSFADLVRLPEPPPPWWSEELNVDRASVRIVAVSEGLDGQWYWWDAQVACPYCESERLFRLDITLACVHELDCASCEAPLRLDGPDVNRYLPPLDANLFQPTIDNDLLALRNALCTDSGTYPAGARFVCLNLAIVVAKLCADSIRSQGVRT